MRITGPNANTAVASGPAARRTAEGTFSLAEGQGARAAGAAGALRSVGGIDALIALQGVEDPTERRRQALRRGRFALDALEELKIGLLAGPRPPARWRDEPAMPGWIRCSPRFNSGSMSKSRK